MPVDDSGQKLVSLLSSRIFRACLAAGVLAVAALSFIVWSKGRDFPPHKQLETKGSISYNDIPILATLDCDCPAVLTASVGRTLHFEVHLRRASAAPPIPTLPVQLYLNISAANATIEPSETLLGDMSQLSSGAGIDYSVMIKVTPQDASLSGIVFQVEKQIDQPGPSANLGSVVWVIDSQASNWSLIAPYLYSVLVFGFAVGIYLWADYRVRLRRKHMELKLLEAKKQADANPQQARFAWDLARVKLEAYFDRNLVQVNMVFWVAVVVMAVGFAFVLAGIVLMFSRPDIWKTPLLAGISGVITQFIGASFMVIYRSTITQANKFMTVLERINSVGMAVQILDSLPEGTDLKNTARADLSILLVDGNSKYRKAEIVKVDALASQ